MWDAGHLVRAVEVEEGHQVQEVKVGYLVEEVQVEVEEGHQVREVEVEVEYLGEKVQVEVEEEHLLEHLIYEMMEHSTDDTKLLLLLVEVGSDQPGTQSPRGHLQEEGEEELPWLVP